MTPNLGVLLLGCTVIGAVGILFGLVI